MYRHLVRVVVAVVLAVTLGTVSGCSLLGDNSTTLTADFTSASGLFVGNDVGVLGVAVGKVTKIVPDGAVVKVTMKINGDQRIPASAGAVVVSRSVATDRYVELTPVYSSGPRMQSGATIPVQRTRTPVEFDEVLGTLGNLSEDLAGSGASRNAVKKLLGTMSTTLKGRGTKINTTVHSLSAASTVVSGQRKNVASTMDALDHLTGSLAKDQGTIRAFITQVDQASQLLAAERTNFKSSITQVTKSIQVVATFAKENRTDMRNVVAKTNLTLKTVQAKKAQVTDLLRELPLALQNLTRTLKPDNRVLVRLDATELTPLGGILQGVCAAIGDTLCTSIGLDPLGLGTLLGGLGLGATP